MMSSMESQECALREERAFTARDLAFMPELTRVKKSKGLDMGIGDGYTDRNGQSSLNTQLQPPPRERPSTRGRNASFTESYESDIRDFAYEERNPNIVPPSSCLCMYDNDNYEDMFDLMDEKASPDHERVRRSSAPEIDSGRWGVLLPEDDLAWSVREEVKETMVLKFPSGKGLQRRKEKRKIEKRLKCERSDGTRFSYPRGCEEEEKDATEEFVDCRDVVAGVEGDDEASECESFVSARGESQEGMEEEGRIEVRSAMSADETAESTESPVYDLSPKHSPNTIPQKEDAEGTSVKNSPESEPPSEYSHDQHESVEEMEQRAATLTPLPPLPLSDSALPLVSSLVLSSEPSQEQDQPRGWTDQRVATLTFLPCETDLPSLSPLESDKKPNSQSRNLSSAKNQPSSPKLDNGLGYQSLASSPQPQEPSAEAAQNPTPPSPSPSTTPESLDDRLEALFNPSSPSHSIHQHNLSLPTATYSLPLSAEDDDKIPVPNADGDQNGDIQIPAPCLLPQRRSSLTRSIPPSRPRSRPCSPFPFLPGELDSIVETSSGDTSDLCVREQDRDVVSEQIDDLLHNGNQQNPPVNHTSEDFLGVNNPEDALNTEVGHNDIDVSSLERNGSSSTEGFVTTAITTSTNRGSDHASSDTSRSSLSRKLGSLKSRTRRFFGRPEEEGDR